jgi:hypothetical protein
MYKGIIDFKIINSMVSMTMASHGTMDMIDVWCTENCKNTCPFKWLIKTSPMGNLLYTMQFHSDEDLTLFRLTWL